MNVLVVRLIHLVLDDAQMGLQGVVTTRTWNGILRWRSAMKKCVNDMIFAI